jgi:3-phosphoshikimate 1-carboxyvinyltransferase
LDSVKIYPRALNGEIIVPPSKSLSHRAIICAGLAEGVSVIDNLVMSEDIKATLEGMAAFGAEVEFIGPGPHRPGEPYLVNIKGNAGVAAQCRDTAGRPDAGAQYRIINCRESGSTLRFLIPLACVDRGGGVHAEEVAAGATFTGEGKLVQRPLDAYYEIFQSQGISYNTTGGRLPLTVKGALKPGVFRVRGDISSQFISGLMFALPFLDGDSAIEVTTALQSRGYVELTLDVLETFGIEVKNDGFKRFFIRGNQRYKSTNYRVEGDYSQAAFWMAAGVLDGGIKCSGLSLNSAQGDRAIIDIIRQMGGNIRTGSAKADGGEAGSGPDGAGEKQDLSFVEALPSATCGTTMDASQCPDLVPVLAVLGALSRGVTRIVNAKRLRIKESDRLKAVSTELNKLGAKVAELEDGLIIEGKETLRGGRVDSWNDHRIAMALAVASIKCTQPVIITGSGAVKKSYPHFWRDFSSLGGETDPPPQ